MKKSKADVVKGLLRKAESDLANARTCLSAGQAFDTVCFHAQQTAEKTIKAYLTAHEIEFPYTHNLEKLIELCARCDPSFPDIKALGEGLTPYAGGLRYDDEFWPSAKTATEALEAALVIVQFVEQRLPEDCR